MRPRDDRPKLTLLPFFIRGLVNLLPDFPDINAHYDEEAGVLKRFAAIHIGIATQTRAGLMVPVVRHAETRDLWDWRGKLPGSPGRRATAARRATSCVVRPSP